jgi:hypothetical protein
MAQTPSGIFRPGEFSHGDTEFFTIYSLVDVTDSGIITGSGKEYQQAQNLSVLLQTIGLRCQPFISSVMKLVGQNVSNYEFGTAHSGNHSIWVTKFATEFSSQTNVDALTEDIHAVPIFENLDDSATVGSTFDCVSSDDKNTYIIKNTEL